MISTRKRPVPPAPIIPAVIGATAAAMAYGLIMRPWHKRWGASSEEATMTLPGDEIVPRPNETVTHAITIHAPIETVWSWVVQIGQTKGGFYSYTWLENLVGCRMRNAERIVPEFQQLSVGDEVWLHPKAPPLPVVYLEPGRTLVLGSNMDEPGTWGFYLKPVDERTTRLIIRGRSRIRSGPVSWIGHYILFEPAHFIMERKMLLGIKARAEGKHFPCSRRDKSLTD